MDQNNLHSDVFSVIGVAPEKQCICHNIKKIKILYSTIGNRIKVELPGVCWHLLFI